MVVPPRSFMDHVAWNISVRHWNTRWPHVRFRFFGFLELSHFNLISDRFRGALLGLRGLKFEDLDPSSVLAAPRIMHLLFFGDVDYVALKAVVNEIGPPLRCLLLS